MRVNADGVDAVAQACTDQRERPVLVLVSSLAAAGHSGDRPAVESDIPAPVSDYGRSKLAGEQVAMRYADTLPITVVRPCIVFGAGDRGMFEVFKPIARSGLACRRRLRRQRRFADRRCGSRRVPRARGGAGRAARRPTLRDGHLFRRGGRRFVHRAWPRDRARARQAAAPHSRICPAWSMRAIGRFGDVVSRIRGRPGWVGRDKIREVLAGSWTCSSAKARQQLGWSPAAPLADRLRETAQWYRDARWL